jgi:hypothetical protein
MIVYLRCVNTKPACGKSDWSAVRFVGNPVDSHHKSLVRPPALIRFAGCRKQRQETRIFPNDPPLNCLSLFKLPHMNADGFETLKLTLFVGIQGSSWIRGIWLAQRRDLMNVDINTVG